jgi:Leucine-rich repeat (LRR) protein
MGGLKLKCIYLGYNRLQYLHPVVLLNIQQLYLKINPKLTIPTDRNFIKSHFLSRLEIAGCNASSVSVETFANVSALEWFDMSENNQKTADIKVLRALPELSELYLYGNWLQRDCQLQEVWRWCEDHDRRKWSGEMAAECDTPGEVCHIFVIVLSTKNLQTNCTVLYCTVLCCTALKCRVL